jgi:esterase
MNPRSLGRFGLLSSATIKLCSKPHGAIRSGRFAAVLLAMVLAGRSSAALAQQPLAASASVRCAWELPAGVKTLFVNGYPMAYTERGIGPAVVFVHGALCDYRFWEPQLASLSSRVRVIAVSLRHHFPEQWDGTGTDYSIRTHSEDLARFIEGLGVGAVDVVGHSRGGAVAAMLALARPDLVRRLVLAEPGIFSLLPLPLPDDPRAKGVRFLNERFAVGDVEGALEFFIDTVNAPGAWKKRPAAARQVARENAWTISRQATDTESLGTQGMASLKMPVLLIGGGKSPQKFGAILDAVQLAIPGAVRETLPDADHQVPRTNPEAFDRGVLTFLAK